MKTVKEIIAFVRKAMEKRHCVSTHYHTITICKKIYNENKQCYEKCLGITYYDDKEKLTISLSAEGYITRYMIFTDKRDITEWNLLLEDVRDYSENKAYKEFDTYFDE